LRRGARRIGARHDWLRFDLTSNRRRETAHVRSGGYRVAEGLAKRAIVGAMMARRRLASVVLLIVVKAKNEVGGRNAR